MSKVFYKLLCIKVQYAIDLSPRAEQSQENSKGPHTNTVNFYCCFFSSDHGGTSTVPRSGNSVILFLILKNWAFASNTERKKWRNDEPHEGGPES
jgi:hypothetical protein